MISSKIEIKIQSKMAIMKDDFVLVFLLELAIVFFEHEHEHEHDYEISWGVGITHDSITSYD